MRQAGFTVLELVFAFAILGVVLAYAGARFETALEQARVDEGAAALRSIWSAQRLHRLENGAYAASTQVLADLGILDLSGVQHFRFGMRRKADGFVAWADRTGAAWTGRLTIDARGDIDGRVSDAGGNVVAPSP